MDRSAAGATRRATRRSYRVLVSVFLGLAVAVAIGAVANGGIPGLQLSMPAPGSGLVEVTYSLTGSASGADITYTDGAGNVQQQTRVAVPLGTSGHSGMTFHAHHGAVVVFTAQNVTEGGDLTCTISSEGVVLNTGHANGGYAIVSCSAQVP
jgi:hypothetical protein